MSSATERALPHNLEAERALLGSVLLDNGALNIILDVLNGEAHHSPVVDTLLGVWREIQAVQQNVLERLTLAELIRRTQQASGLSYQI